MNSAATLSIHIYSQMPAFRESRLFTFFLTTDSLFQESSNYFLGKKEAGGGGKGRGRRRDKLQSSLWHSAQIFHFFALLHLCRLCNYTIITYESSSQKWFLQFGFAFYYSYGLFIGCFHNEFLKCNSCSL